ncbi:MAG: hypothetical protein SGPRY_011241, partial [Prymnesium sp.]
MSLVALPSLLAVSLACGPTPPVWPLQFMLVQRKVAHAHTAQQNASVVTWYDHINGANLLQIAPENNSSDVLWDLELNTHSSFYFTPSRRTCKRMHFPVGVLRPDWLSNATFLGTRTFQGRSVLAWTKVDFIDYFADPVTCEPASFNTVLFVPNRS